TRLLKLGAKVKAYDPMGGDNARKIFENVEIFQDPYSALDGSDVVLILTAWKDFRDIDWKKVRDSVKNPVIIDSVGVLRGLDMEGWKVWMVGRGYL
ncbi:MAG: UDP binding domain-containing protein, partial [Candidatus Caldipriscus sp.]